MICFVQSTVLLTFYGLVHHLLKVTTELLFIYFAFKREYRVFDNLFSYLFYLITMIIDITHMTCGAYCILMCWWFFLVLVPVGERLALRTHYMFHTFTDNISKYEVTILRQIRHFSSTTNLAGLEWNLSGVVFCLN